MFRNYLIIALRNIVRHKLYSFINIAGLAVGLTCVILIMLFVRDELSYDKWIPGSDKLYRVEVTFYPPGRPAIPLAQTSMPMPAAMRDQIPEVRAMTRLALENMAITVGDRQFSERVHGGGPEFPASHPAAAGGGRSAHRAGASGIGGPDPSHGAEIFRRCRSDRKDDLSPEAGLRAGGCSCDNSTVPLKVTGVMRDLPHNTQLYVDMLVPNTSIVDRVDRRSKHNWLPTATPLAMWSWRPAPIPPRWWPRPSP